MTISLVLVGTAQDKGTASVLLTPYIARSNFAVGQYIIACIAADSDATPSEIRIYAQGSGFVQYASLNQVTASNTGNVITSIVYVRITNIPGTTEDLAVQAYGLTTGDSKAFAVYLASGLLETGAYDTSSTGLGSSTTPSSGSSDALALAIELVIGAVGTEDNVEDITGSWTTGVSYVSGNENQTGTTGGGGTGNVCIRSAAEVVNSNAAQTAAITGIASADWAAVVATFISADAYHNISVVDTVTVNEQFLSWSKLLHISIIEICTVSDFAQYFNRVEHVSAMDTVELSLSEPDLTLSIRVDPISNEHWAYTVRIV